MLNIRSWIALGLLVATVGCTHAPHLKKMTENAPESCKVDGAPVPQSSISRASPILNAIFENDAQALKKIVGPLGKNLTDSPQSMADKDLYAKDLNTKDALGFSYLHLAVSVDNPEIIDVLIDAGMDVNLKAGAKKNTPAHSAVRWKALASLQRLVQRGADLSVKNLDGKSPGDLAQDRQMRAFFESLKEPSGGKVEKDTK